MKRKIISWFLVVACCLSLLPGNLVIAEESGGTYPISTNLRKKCLKDGLDVALEKLIKATINSENI